MSESDLHFHTDRRRSDMYRVLRNGTVISLSKSVFFQTQTLEWNVVLLSVKYMTLKGFPTSD